IGISKLDRKRRPPQLQGLVHRDIEERPIVEQADPAEEDRVVFAVQGVGESDAWLECAVKFLALAAVGEVLRGINREEELAVVKPNRIPNSLRSHVIVVEHV